MGKASVAGAAEMRRVGFQHADTSEPVLRDHSWEIDSGSFNLIVGSSGSGKSTLLRLLNGLVPHFSGGSFGGRVSVSGLDTLDA
ncbi:MAG: ATP-binding cassette domain-containing protein, partial [Thermomicrobiales bacterium]